ncbi:MAG: hypothetical protein AAF702_41850 [Chloroflexota bacterium]
MPNNGNQFRNRTVHWISELIDANDDGFQDRGLYQIDGETIEPIRYQGGIQEVKFKVRLPDIDPRDYSDSAIYTWKVIARISDRLGNNSSEFTNEINLLWHSIALSFDAEGVLGSLQVDPMLADLNAKINHNLLDLEVRFEVSNGDDEIVFSGNGRTETPLHLLLQKAIVLLPGVLASNIWIGDTKCWINPGPHNAERLHMIRCHASGNPVNEATRIEFVSPGDPYETERWQRWLHTALPNLTCTVRGREHKVLYYRFQGYPYDWRLKTEQIIDQLLGAENELDDETLKHILKDKPSFRGEQGRGVRPPSIKTIVKSLKPSCPFLDDKVSLVGHSTGGVVIHGLIRRDGAEDVIDKAFFVGAPFLGALKAYNAFLTGKMDLLNGFIGTNRFDSLILDQDKLLELGSNLAILYYLAPTHQFPYPAAKITYQDGTEKYFNRQHVDANEFMDEMIRLAELHQLKKLTKNGTHWNRNLADAADTFHRTCAVSPIQIELDHCIVFYSSEGPCSTIGEIRYDARDSNRQNNFKQKPENRIDYVLSGGDGTVPAESLKGGLPPSSWYEVGANAGQRIDHVSIIAQKELWLEIARKLPERD